MFIAVCRMTLRVPGARSLKDKRAALRRIKDRTASKLRVMVAEVGEQDVWQRAVIGFAVVSGDGSRAERTVDEAVRFIASVGVADVLADDRELVQLEDDDFGPRDWLGEKYE